MIPDPLHINGQSWHHRTEGVDVEALDHYAAWEATLLSGGALVYRLVVDQFAGFWTTSGPTPGLVLIAVIPEVVR